MAAGTRDLNLLVVTTGRVPTEAVSDEIDRQGAARANVKIVAPTVTESTAEHIASDVDSAIDRASRRLGTSLDRARRAGADATDGEVGEADPVMAIEDALRTFPADEILIVTREEEEADWQERRLMERARARFDQPLARTILDGDQRRSRWVVERAGPGTDLDATTEEAAPVRPSRNLPPDPRRDVFGIGFAILGSFALFAFAVILLTYAG